MQFGDLKIILKQPSKNVYGIVNLARELAGSRISI